MITFPNSPNVKTRTYDLQTRKMEDGKEEYRFVDSTGNQLGRVFNDPKEALEVMREWLRNQPNQP